MPAFSVSLNNLFFSLPSFKRRRFSTRSSSSSSSASTLHLQEKNRTFPKVRDKIMEVWSQFAKRVSGEWNGFGADFSNEGKPIELPELVVPEAYKAWEVKVFDWQTQCPTLAEPENRILVYKSIQLYPTVGCDAATPYSRDNRKVHKSVRDGNSNIFLPKKLWCSLKQSKDGEVLSEVGWVLDHGKAITSSCLFSSTAMLKEISLALEIDPYSVAYVLGNGPLRKKAFF